MAPALAPHRTPRFSSGPVNQFPHLGRERGAGLTAKPAVRPSRSDHRCRQLDSGSVVARARVVVGRRPLWIRAEARCTAMSPGSGRRPRPRRRGPAAGLGPFLAVPGGPAPCAATGPRSREVSSSRAADEASQIDHRWVNKHTKVLADAGALGRDCVCQELCQFVHRPNCTPKHPGREETHGLANGLQEPTGRYPRQAQSPV